MAPLSGSTRGILKRPSTAGPVGAGRSTKGGRGGNTSSASAANIMLEMEVRSNMSENSRTAAAAVKPTSTSSMAASRRRPHSVSATKLRVSSTKYKGRIDNKAKAPPAQEDEFDLLQIRGHLVNKPVQVIS